MALKNEKDFESYLIKNYGTKFGMNLFPLVSRIGGEIISPEIDLLKIEQTGINKAFITGYEFKFLDSKKADVNYKRIHAGIGQALMYFQYGIDRCYLVIGISKRLDDRTRVKVMSKYATLKGLMRNLESLHSKPLDYLGVWLFVEAENQELLSDEKVAGRFPDFPFAGRDSETNTFVLNKNNLVAGRFKYSKSFRKRCGLSPRLKMRFLS